MGPVAGSSASDAVADAVHSPWRPLDAAARASAESRFGHNFGSVRIHDGEPAQRAAQRLGLEAFTVGNDIGFARGVYQPRQERGAALLQHELGHVSRGEGRGGTIEGWAPDGHRTITLNVVKNDRRYSAGARSLLVETVPTLDYNRIRILQDMISFWARESPLHAVAGGFGGGVLGALTPPGEGMELAGVRWSGVLPQAILGTGLIPTLPEKDRERGTRDNELRGTRDPEELANHGEATPAQNEARMNQYVVRGIAAANRSELNEGLRQLAYALHVAQDRGSHGDGYTARYVQGRPHSQIDSMSNNPEGVGVALMHSTSVINRFYNGLTGPVKQQLANATVVPSLRSANLLEQVSSTVLRPEGGGRTPSMEEQRPRGINILTINFDF